MAERILTKHPEGKSGVNIDKQKYDTIRTAIVETLRDNEGTTFNDLTEDIRQQLQNTFVSSIPWYVTTVKLDLEARGVIERIPESSPQQLRLVEN